PGEVRARPLEVRDRVRQALGFLGVAEQLAHVSLPTIYGGEDPAERGDALLEVVVEPRLGERLRRALEVADDPLDAARDDAQATHHLREIVARPGTDFGARRQ